MTTENPVVVVAAKRTPLGRFQGSLASVAAPTLGATAIRACLEETGLDPSLVDQVVMGCVLSAGLRQAPARQAALEAGLPQSTGATTVNKVCGSGMKSIMLARDMIASGSAEVVIAGGMESMSNAPYLLANARAGYRIGHEHVFDHVMLDGLEDAYEGGRPMGSFGEATAEKYGFSRDGQDAYAIETLRRAKSAIEEGAFGNEIAPLDVAHREGVERVKDDEIPLKLDPERIPTLRAAFKEGGTITAASASANADGAAALLLMRRNKAIELGLTELACIAGQSEHSHDPAWFTTAPIPAIEKLLDKLNWSADDVDLFEVNEAFAAVSMAAANDIGIPTGKLNVNGGACALGHPIGATGARILVTLIHALQNRSASRGLASLCIGGGEATAVAIERAT